LFVYLWLEDSDELAGMCFAVNLQELSILNVTDRGDWKVHDPFNFCSVKIKISRFVKNFVACLFYCADEIINLNLYNKIN
jgi:hypothetical protein